MITHVHLPLTMHTCALVVFFFLFPGHGCKVQSPLTSSGPVGELHPLQALANVIAAFNSPNFDRTNSMHSTRAAPTKHSVPLLTESGRSWTDLLQSDAAATHREIVARLENLLDDEAAIPEKKTPKDAKTEPEDDSKLQLRMRQLFQSCDKNGDGILDRDEASEYFAKVAMLLKNDPRFKRSPEKIKELLKKGNTLDGEAGYEVGDTVEAMDGNQGEWWPVRITDKNLDGTYGGSVLGRNIEWDRIEPRFIRKIRTEEDKKREELERQMNKAQAEELKLDIARNKLEKRLAKEAKEEAARKAREKRKQIELERMNLLFSNEIKADSKEQGDRPGKAAQHDSQALDFISEAEEEIAAALGSDADKLDHFFQQQKLQHAADMLPDVDIDDDEDYLKGL